MSRTYTEKQRQIIDSFGSGQAVVAGAGCGKTTTLVAKCLALVRHSPEARFCAVSFTEKSVRDLKESLARGFLDEGITQDRQSYWVKTIHGLCSTILQEFPVQAGLQGGERILLEDESGRLWGRSVNLLWSQNENQEVSAALDRLLQVYSKKKLETLLAKLRSLMSFGVEDFIRKTQDRPEVQDLWLVFELVYRRYQHYKMREGALDFNDLEILALKALQDESVCRYYQQRFELVMVDEFQDTNPIQGQILERFVKPGFTNLCIVGDPKQSIYRFRDADVSVFQDLTERLPLKHLLDTNYRSRPEIIEFVNEVCAPLFAASELPYEALIAGRDDEEFNDPRVSRLALEDESTLARFLKAEETRGVDLSEFVILARSLRKDKTQKFIQALEAEQVPFLLGSGGRFYADPRVRELVAFLKGWTSSKNTLSQVAALRAPWIGVSDDDLMRWKDRYFECFFAESDHPVAQVLRQDFVQNTPLRPGEILEKLWDVLDLEMDMPLVSLWHKAESLSSQGRRFEDVVQTFSQAIEENRIEKEVPPPAQKGVVRLMTVHGSKGLQFPRVILLDFDGEYRSRGQSQDLIWDRKRGVHLFHLTEEGERDKKHPENLNWQELEKRAAVAESKRVFYVAVTRAQEALILAWKSEVKASVASQKEGYQPLMIDHWRAWVEHTRLPEAWPFEAATEPETEAKESEVIRTQPDRPSSPFASKTIEFDPGVYRPRHSPSEWMVLNQCALRYQRRFLENRREEEKEIRTVENGAVRDRSGVRSDEVAQQGEQLHAWIENEQWEELATVTASVEPFRKFLDQAQTPTLQIYREQAFEIPLNDEEALVGMMDRLEIDEARRSVRIVDYKWTAKARPADELLSHYLLQLQLYAWAATKLIAFVPEKLEACLAHFTVDSFEIVHAPAEAMKLDGLESQVFQFFSQARDALAVTLRSQENLPKTGDHCRYCEFQKSCPAFPKAG